MKLFDELIQRMQNLLDAEGSRSYPVVESDWPAVTDRSMILRSDMAYELGGDFQPAIGCTVVTLDENLVGEDDVTLLGKDLHEIQSTTNVPYARIAFVRIKADGVGEGEALYNAIRKLENTRYHFFPEGFMMRISASKHKETVRIGKEALEKGLCFAKAGNMMIQAFHENPLVEAVQVRYVTLEDFDYKTLEGLVNEAEDVTKTIDHIFKNVVMDCNACNLQEICDEVEGLRELHFAQAEEAKNV